MSDETPGVTDAAVEAARKELGGWCSITQMRAALAQSSAGEVAQR